MNRKHLNIVLAAASMTVALAACSSTSTATQPTSKPKVAAGTKTAAPAPSALSGPWSGTYSGAYSGTFKLHWTQSGSQLHGRISVSSLGGGWVPINGTVNGTAIRFGTVGSTAITYTGTVSGNSMSGTYKVENPNGSSGGPWSASKG